MDGHWMDGHRTDAKVNLYSVQCCTLHWTDKYFMCGKLYVFDVSSDFALYGLCPARDEFYLVVCEICGVLVKPQALQQHTGIITAITRLANFIACTCESKSIHTRVFIITSPNIDQFSKFFHWHTLHKICNKVIVKDPTTPETLCILHYLVKYKYQKVGKVISRCNLSHHLLAQKWN